MSNIVKVTKDLTKSPEKKVKAAKGKTAPAAKAKTESQKKLPAPRKPAFADDAKITVLVADNPYRENSNRWVRLNLLRKCPTVGVALKDDRIQPKNLRFFVAAKVIKINGGAK